MARWLVQLDGHSFDLEEFPFWFPDGEIHAIAEEHGVYLTGDGLERFQTAEEVRAAALQAADDFSAIIALLWPSLQRPSVGHVYREDDHGRRSAQVFLSGAAVARSKVRGVLRVAGQEASEPVPTQAQQLLAASRASDNLRAAIVLWADPVRSWPRLYRVLEEIERHLGQQADKAGLCSGRQRERFTRTANAAEVAGSDARHALGRFVPPSDPMSNDEAASYVRSVLEAVLRREAAS